MKTTTIQHGKIVTAAALANRVNVTLARCRRRDRLKSGRLIKAGLTDGSKRMDIGKVTFGPAERAVAGRGTRAVSTDTALQARIEALERALRGLCQACEDSGYYHLLEHSDIGHWWESQKRATR